MPSKEILREVLEKVRANGIIDLQIESVAEWNGKDALKYSEAISWLSERGLINAIKDEQCSCDPVHEFFSAKINSYGIEFLENGCEFKNEPVTIRIDEKQLDQFKTLLLSIAESVGDKRDVFTLRSFFNRAGAAGVSAFMAESVKLGLSNLSVILSKF